MTDNINILLVEDNPEDRMVIRLVLEQAIENVVIVDTDSKDKAYEELRSTQFDIILTDLHLQGFTGWDVVNQVRKLDLNVPVILITGDWKTETILEALLLQVDDYIVKSMKYIKRLPEIIDRVLGQAPLEQLRRTSRDNPDDTIQTYNEVFETSDELIQSLWPDCSFMNANRAWCETLGYAKRDITSRNFLDMLHVGSKKIFEAALGEISTGQTMKPVELLINSKAGRKIYVEATGTARMVNGRSVATHWVFKDISVEKNMEDLLKDSKDQYVSAFEFAPTPLLLSDNRGRVLKANSAACELIGLSLEEMLDVHMKDITHPDDLEESLTLHKKLLSGELDMFTMEKRYRHKSGQYVWVKVTASLVRNDHGIPRYAIAQLEDITARKKVGEILQK